MPFTVSIVACLFLWLVQNCATIIALLLLSLWFWSEVFQVISLWVLWKTFECFEGYIDYYLLSSNFLQSCYHYCIVLSQLCEVTIGAKLLPIADNCESLWLVSGRSIHVCGSLQWDFSFLTCWVQRWPRHPDNLWSCCVRCTLQSSIFYAWIGYQHTLLTMLECWSPFFLF